jgi:hypothetical protein
MVRIKLASRSESDVTKMKAKGWVINVFRERNERDDFVIAERDVINTRFTLQLAKVPHTVEVKKFVNGEFIDSKLFHDPGCGLSGTLCISEGKTVTTTYAFFRNEMLMELMERYGLKRIEFAKTDAAKFDKFVYENDLSMYGKGEGKPTLPPFHTDGTYEETTPQQPNMRKFLVSGATYVYEYKTCTLTIPQQYDIWKLDELLKHLTD